MRAVVAPVVSAVVVAAVLLVAATQAGTADPPVDRTEQRVEELLAKLTLREKVSLMAGGTTFGMAAVPRLGIPALSLSDGPNGVRSNDDQTATVFPVGVAMGATWNPSTIQAVGQAIGREARALAVHVLLGPNVNIQRTPLAGRNFETYSEDPLLAGRLGTGFVRGVQGEGVGTSVKHFVANEQETERLRSSSNVDERALREIYLAPFEAIVRDAHPWTVMAAYNRVNGTYMTENARILRDVLKGEWGFDGLLVSDWGAVHSTAEAANGGTDLEMPGPPRYFGSALLQAVRLWQVDPKVVDDAARRALRLIVRSGALDAKPSREGKSAPTGGALRSADNRRAALAAAQEAITLLKNDGGLLPLELGKVKRIALIGPNADVPLYQGGGSSAVTPSRTETPLAQLQALARGIEVTYTQGVDNDPVPPPLEARYLSTARDGSKRGGQAGLAFSYYRGPKLAGAPARSGVEEHFDKLMIASDLAEMSARYQGFFWPPRTGTYRFSLTQRGSATLAIDGRELIGERTPPQAGGEDFGGARREAGIELVKDRPYRVTVEYTTTFPSFHTLRLGMRLPPSSIDAAVEAAKAADVAVVMVGASRTSESEGRDRTDMELYGRQNELVEAVLAANPRTVVVLHNGAPLSLPWVERVPALLEAWLPGEEGPQALAQVLLGDVNPSGKLPLTFPRRIEDNPTFLHYGAGRDANYGEGVFVGYRYYEKKKVAPLFAFGHGLSYTTFEYGGLQAPAQAADAFEVSLTVRNTGTRAGSETVQLYVEDLATATVTRPVKELKGFAKVALQPGETRTVKLALNARAFAYYDVHVHDWVVTPGRYRLHVGSSSADIRQRAELTWTGAPDPRVMREAADFGL